MLLNFILAGKNLGWKKKIFSGKSEFIEIPRSRSQDIDNIEDWKGAENLWKFNKKTR